MSVLAQLEPHIWVSLLLFDFGPRGNWERHKGAHGLENNVTSATTHPSPCVDLMRRLAWVNMSHCWWGEIAWVSHTLATLSAHLCKSHDNVIAK